MDRELKLKPCRKSQYVSDRMKVARAVPAVQFARAPVKRAGGHSQENPLESYSCSGRVAQLGEHLLCKQGVAGSIPATSTNHLPANQSLTNLAAARLPQFGSN